MAEKEKTPKIKSKQPATPAKLPAQRRKQSALDDTAIVALHEAGQTTRQIAPIAGLSKTTIARRLKHLTPRKSTEIFKELKADIFAEKQRKLLMSSDKLTPKEQRDIAVAVGCYHDKEQQLRGNSSDGKPLVIINRISVGENMHRDQVIEVQTSQNSNDINTIGAD